MMQLRYAVTGLAVVLSLAGCQRTAYDYNSGPGAAPAPLTAQPVPSVQGGQLPPPTTSSQFPAAPTTAPMQGGQPGAVAAAGLDVTKESMVGSWRVNSAGASCDMFLTLTNLGSGSRGGTRGCVGELTAMGSWEVAGKQVLLKDRSGNQIGSLVKTADNRFDGQTATGQQISLSR